MHFTVNVLYFLVFNFLMYSNSRNTEIQHNYLFYLQINDNGILSFNSSFDHYLPNDFLLYSNKSLIAPFWADFYTCYRGTVWFGMRSNDFHLLKSACENLRIYFSNMPKSKSNFLQRGREFPIIDL